MKILKKIAAFFVAPFFLIKVSRKRKKDEILIVIPPKLGDMAYGMMFAKQLKKETGKKIAVFCNEKNKKFVENYSCVDRIETYKGSYFNRELYFLAIGMGYSLRRRNFGGGKVIYTAPPPYFLGNKNVIDIYAQDLFRVKDREFELLKLKKPVKITSIENFDANKDKIVVLNSYSDSYIKECQDFFKEIAKILHSKGYIVYSNVVGDQTPVENTLALKCPVDEFYSICENVKAFITIRSGILDVVVATKCQKHVIYMKKNAYRYHSVKSLNSNINEYEVYDSQQEKEFLKNFEETF